jgi:regulator of protease activity HflC (stomatin/prohibitin superfamily)
MNATTAAPPAAKKLVPVAPVTERPAWKTSGWVGVIGSVIVAGAGVWGLVVFESAQAGGGRANVPLLVASLLGLLLGGLVPAGCTIVIPGATKVVVLFGRYVGTVREPGFWLTVPLATRSKLSVRVRNFETGELKVNDADGNPVNIAAIVVWQVADTALASFAVESYEDFVEVQAESALRHVATSHPYDGPESTVTLRGSTEQVSEELAAEVAARVAVAGVSIIEVRISKLAYAPEIAEAMLRRQQAGAIVAAREKIVEGAVEMVRDALQRIDDEGFVHLDDERRAAMVSNLLVVLAGDQRATPVINTGTLYV